MKVELSNSNSTPHIWVAALWCAFGLIVLGAVGVISCWLRKCRTPLAPPHLLLAQQRQHPLPQQSSQQLLPGRQRQRQHLLPQQHQRGPPSQLQQRQQETTIIIRKHSKHKHSRSPVANVKKQFKMFNLYSTMNRRGDEKEMKVSETTGHDRFCQERPSRSSFRKKKKKIRRAQSAAEFDLRQPQLAANKRLLFRGRSVSSEQENSENEHSEKSPLVSTKLESLAKFLFSKSQLPDSSSTTTTATTSSAASANRQDTSCSDSPTRHSVRYQYTALDSGGIGASDRSPKERAAREKAFAATQEWLQNTDGRYEIIAHLDDIGSRHNKHWFLLNDSAIRTDRLMTLFSLPPDCIALEELPPSECPKGILMELLGSLQHPYIHPVLDLDFFHTEFHHYASLVMPFNQSGSLKDLIYKSLWNEPWNRKYTKKSTCLPISQIQRLGRQILEALLFLRERGIKTHGHLHSGNVILQNGVARLSGIENGLLGLNSRVNAVVWSQGMNEIENIDVICFGHLLFEMSAGYELSSPQPTAGHLQLDLERYPQVVEILQLIFESPDGRYPTVQELVLCDLFRNIDLREMRGATVSSFKHGLSNSTMSLLNAVRRRQGAFYSSGSYSEGSSPCTPPSTPRDRNSGKLNLKSTDLSSSSCSDSDGVLDEIVITPCEMDNNYDPLYSPIHYCDNSNNSCDDSNSATQIRISSNEILYESTTSTSPSPSTGATQKYYNQQHDQLTPSSAYKNSKSRRIEYSMKSLKLGVSNPSQDSAFGSMTDGELSHANSFKLSSFQSITSPIDEGVEDIAITCDENNLLATASANLKYIDSTGSSPCHESSFGQRDAIGGSSASLSVSQQRLYQPQFNQPLKETSISYLEPPKLMLNDHYNNPFIYTSSPIRKCATTEVFSQKYRVSSFEDMTYNNSRYNNKLSNTMNKKPFRSFEEEKRIETAFMPINSQAQSSTNFASSSSNLNGNHTKTVNNQLTENASSTNSPSASTSHLASAACTSKSSHKSVSGRERNISWRSTSRKNNLIKSNESLFETSFDKLFDDDTPEVPISKHMGRGNSVNEIFKDETERYNLAPESSLLHTHRKSRSERYLFSLAKFKHNAISDSVTLDYLFEDEKLSDNAVKPKSRREMKKQFSEETTSDDSSATEALIKTPTHEDIRKFIGGLDDPDPGGGNCRSEEKTPLLDGMEMSPISPSESEHML